MAAERGSCDSGGLSYGRRIALASLLVLGLSTPPLFAEGVKPDFVREVLPILKRSCIECHGPEKQQGGLRLDKKADAFRGGDSGPVIVPGKPDNSELLRRVNLADGDTDLMPARRMRLPTAQIAVVRNWIETGADWPDSATAITHWAYEKPQRPFVPQTNNTNWPRNDLDQFVLHRLEQEGLKPAAQADRATLIRRVSLDLVGLPPSPAEVLAFEQDRDEEAYERLVNRLLNSPQFGGRWARPWLDLARYADSHGYQRDDLREIWPYRDWVIRAINEDLPFDQFTIEQLAGDLLPNATISQRIATGFCRCATVNVEAGSEPEETRVNQVFDRVNTLGIVWLGTTLECAQCHDHKYDPITTTDYYRLFAFFNNSEIEAERSNPNVPGSIRFLGPSLTIHDAEMEAERALLKSRLKSLIDERDLRLSEDSNVDTQSHGQSDVSTSELLAEIASLEQAVNMLKSPATLVMKELDAPRSTTVFRRGNYQDHGAAVQPGTPAVLPPFPAGQSDRLALARWLVSRDNPLTARVTVNRWWSEIFGHGLVGTVDDFGSKGDLPTHPDLLDWLAIEFMDRGWSLKQWLRLVVTSATYRQSSVASPELRNRDPENQLYARGPRLRLDAETIRDNALAIAGLLSLKQGGPPIRPYQPAGLWTKIGGDKVDYVVSSDEDRFRRGIYVVWKRAALYPSFANFDAPTRLSCIARRSRSNTPLQALTLLNDPVYVEAAMSLAKRVLLERPAPATTEEQIQYAFRLCVSRSPTSSELATLVRLYSQQYDVNQEHRARVRQLIMDETVPEGIAKEEFVAWYSVATALMNLDETITKE